MTNPTQKDIEATIRYYLPTLEANRVIASIHSSTQSSVSKAEERMEKAYGGCRKCYGKGYSTHMGSEEGYGPIELMDYCDCGRGKQLKRLFTNSPKGK